MRTIIPSTVKTRRAVGRSTMLDAYTPLATYQPPLTRLGPARAARPAALGSEAPRHARHRRPLRISLPRQANRG